MECVYLLFISSWLILLFLSGCDWLYLIIYRSKLLVYVLFKLCGKIKFLK